MSRWRTEFAQQARGVARALGVAGLLIFNVCSESAAQSTSPAQITPRTLRPAGSSSGGAIALPGSAPLDVPKGLETLSVTIAGVEFQDGFPELAEALKPLSAKIVGRRASVADLYAYASAVEQVYATVGYVLVRIVVPPQKVVDGGVFKLVVVDGFIEDIDVARLSDRVQSPVRARVNALLKKRHMKLEEIERKVLLASEIPGLRLKSTLVRGTEQGGVRLVLEGPFQAVQGSLSGSNPLSRDLGTWQTSASGAVNSALGSGEQIYGTYGGSGDLDDVASRSGPLAFAGAGAVIPLGTEGLIINPEYTWSKSRPELPPGSLKTEGLFERFALRAAYPLVLTRGRTIKLKLDFENIEQTTTATDFGTELDHDHYSVVRTGFEHGFLMPWGAAVTSLIQVSRGIEGRSPEDAANSAVPLSRQGATPYFTKFLGEAHAVQPLVDGLQLTLAVRGQYAFHRTLFESEQLALDSYDTVSGFTSGSFVVDQGVTSRAEISKTFALPIGSISSFMAPYVFAATGRGWITAPTAVERESVSASSVGVGLRFNATTSDGSPSALVTVEGARRFSDDPAAQEGYRASMNASVQF